MLENGMLDDLDIRVLNDLTFFVQDRQGVRLPITRSGILEQLAVEREGEWLAMQDIPVFRIRPNRPIWRAKSPRLSPVVVTDSKSKGKGKAIPFAPTSQRLNRRKGGDDNEIFSMDDENTSDTFSLPAAAVALASPATSLQAATSPGTPGGTPWKSKAVEGQR